MDSSGPMKKPGKGLSSTLCAVSGACPNIVCHVLRWFLDGQVIYKLKKSSLGADQGRWPSENMYILLSNKLQAAAPDSTTSWPNNFKIDYIRLYKWVG